MLSCLSNQLNFFHLLEIPPISWRMGPRSWALTFAKWPREWPMLINQKRGLHRTLFSEPSADNCCCPPAETLVSQGTGALKRPGSFALTTILTRTRETPAARVALERGAVERGRAARVPAHNDCCRCACAARKAILQLPSAPSYADTWHPDPCRVRQKALQAICLRQAFLGVAGNTPNAD